MPRDSYVNVLRSASSVQSSFWGALIPCSPGLTAINFEKSRMWYTVGSGPDNAVVLLGQQISKLMLVHVYITLY